MKYLLAAVLGGLISLGAVMLVTGGSAERLAGAQGTINAFLESHPEMIVDLTDVSGEYCVNTWKVGGDHMTHYATDPSKTTEDVIDFIVAESFLASGVDVTTLPRLPGTLGTMKPGQWYYLPKGAQEPHHGEQSFPTALVVRATDIP